jgi:hypothetical protein
MDFRAIENPGRPGCDRYLIGFRGYFPLRAFGKVRVFEKQAVT